MNEDYTDFIEASGLLKYDPKIISRIYLIVLKYELRQCIKRGNLYHIWFHQHNIIKKPNGLKELDLFLKYFKNLKVEKPQISSYKFTEIG